MEILLISHELGLSGAPRALLNMAKCLKEKNNVNLISPFDGPIGEEFEKIGIKKQIISGLLNGNITNIEDKYDYIIYNTIVSLTCAKSLYNYKAKKIVWVHEGEFAYNLFSTTTFSYGLGRNLNFKDLFKYVDEIYCVSDYSANVTKRYTEKEIKILPYYIDHIEHNRIHHPTDKLIVGMIGTIEERKGIRLLSEALNKVNFPIEIFSVGMVLQPIFNPKIHYLGKAKHDAVINMYDDFDLLLCPSMDDPMPITCAEAFMMKCPVFVSKNTGTYSLIEDKVNGVTFNYDIKSLINTLNWAYENKNLLDDIGKKGYKKYVENFTYEAFNNSIKEIIKK